MSSSKSKKRLSSLFSSSSLSSFGSDKNGSPHKSNGSPVNLTTTSSGASTPTRVTASRYADLNGKSGAPDPKAVANGIEKLNLGTATAPVLASTQTTSPISTVPGPPIRSLSNEAILPSASERPKKERTSSMYSQWNYDDDEGSSDDDQAFLTPSEGLSEVEEEDETEEVQPKSTIIKTNGTKSQNGTAVQDKDVNGTGASTVHRTAPTMSETKVRTRATVRKSPTSIDQAAILSEDLDSCRHVLELFLTSRMKESEDYCFEKDPDGNRLYLQSAHGIIQALKVSITRNVGRT